MSQAQGFKLQLRRLNPTRRNNNQIAKNLAPLNQNSKKLAQNIYYQKHPQHQSPLVKNERAPVHQRLGVKQKQSRRLVPLGTNTSSLLPKKRGFRPRPQLQQRQHKLQRLYSAQARLERIRAQNNLRNGQRLNNNGIIKLRRLNNGLPPATNLTVEVKNPNFVPNGTAFTYQNNIRKFKMILNSQIQEEILEIQRENAGNSIGTLPPMTTITPVTTGVPVSERFGLL